MGRILDPVSISGSQPALANTAVLFGNSIAANNAIIQNGSAAEWYLDGKGAWQWANQALGQRFNFVANKGLAGDTTTGMLARFASDVVPYSAKWLIFTGIAINDITGGAALATITSNITAILAAAKATGMQVLMTTDLTSGSSALQLNTAAKQQMVHDLNHWLRRYARDNTGVLLIDQAAQFSDPTTGLFLTGLTSDGTHPNATGASKLGAYYASVISANDWVKPVDLLPWANNDTTNIFTNGMMLGTSGTGIAGGITGSLATGIVAAQNANVSPSNAPTVALSKVARTDGSGGEWQQGVLTAGDLQLQLFQATSGFSAGDTVYLDVEFQTDASGWTNSPDFRCALFAVTSGFAVLLKQYSIWNISALTGITRATSGIMRVGPMVLPATTARLHGYVWFDGSAVTGSQGTFRIGKVYCWNASTSAF